MNRPPTLSLQELYNMRSDKRQHKTASYQKIVEMCHTRIRTAAKAGEMNCFFEVPSFVLGMPLIMQRECTDFVTEKLRNIGMMVREVPEVPYVIYISWDPNDVRDIRRDAVLPPGLKR